MEAETITEEGGEDLVTFREAARRAVDEGVTPSLTHQRVSQLSKKEGFPPVRKIGRANVVDWRLLKPYLAAHAEKAAARDSRRRPVAGQEGDVD
ncbi:hypothetical protein [Streptomyces sp. Wb2n-11]|uniref:hypothetical protein n=1 Tax=Streptomyces sp. Wb2n-11 TaxID=1030533 RepID=UPI000A97D463|nr:hypothetical protein [Streptomyces sp. Wb2n-11]